MKTYFGVSGKCFQKRLNRSIKAKVLSRVFYNLNNSSHYVNLFIIFQMVM
jgi:hypothetical protein